MAFGVIYQTPPDLLARIPDEIKAVVESQPFATFDRVHAFQFGASSIDFELVFYVDPAEYAVFMGTRQQIMLGMPRRFQELGVEFAYPTQTTFTAAPDGRLVMPYADVKPMAPAELFPVTTFRTPHRRANVRSHCHPTIACRSNQIG